MQEQIARIRQWFETLTPHTLMSIAMVYAPEARFQDPFNQVQGVRAIQSVYQHMFEQLSQPRFVITKTLTQDQTCVMIWTFLFSLRVQEYSIEGCTHFELNAQGLIVLHQDYWDAAQQVYEKIPLLGTALRILRRKLSVPAGTKKSL